MCTPCYVRANIRCERTDLNFRHLEIAGKTQVDAYPLKRGLVIIASSRMKNSMKRPASFVRIQNALTAVVMACVVFFALSSPATAVTGSWQSGKGDYVEGRLISPANGVGSRDKLPIGLHLKLKKGWKTYWRSPGDAGLPPRLNWEKSKNLAKAQLLYPVPERFELFGQQTFGYAKEVVFPINLTLEKTNTQTSLVTTAELLVCENICIPQTLVLTLTIPAEPAKLDTPISQLLSRFTGAVPRPSAKSNIKIDQASVLETTAGPSIQLSIAAQTPLTALDVFPEMDPFVAFSKPQVILSPDQRKADVVLAVTSPGVTTRMLSNQSLRVTVVTGGQAVESEVKLKTSTQLSVGDIGYYAKIIALAVLGGFILNFMPCVLPVLSIKVLSCLKHSEEPPAQVRKSFLATSAGIVFSMLLLASSLIVLKSFGQTVGWGIQFQQPLFIVTLALIVTLFAANLWGFFEIALPAALTNWASQTSSSRQGLVGDFLSGAFATLLATPCSAPFIGTAVGFALSSGSAQILLIFSAMGLGLALPYLLVAANPKVLNAFPSPGNWMIYLRVVLGLALAATAIWLLYVLANQAGVLPAILTGLLLSLIVALLAFRDSVTDMLSPTVVTFSLIGLSATSLALPSLLAPLLQAPTPTSSRQTSEVAWAPFDRDKIRSDIAQGKTVFVDVTADWCITCKTNKSLALHTDRVAAKLSKNIIAMQADWTRPNEDISNFLSSYGRFGIPFNIVYGPGAPGGIILPELLSPNIVIEAIDKARGKQDVQVSPEQ